MMITRRSFLAGTILALPGLRLLAGVAKSLPIKEAEYGFGMDGWPMIWLTTYTNGSVTGRWNKTQLHVIEDRGWLRVYGNIGKATCETRVRRSSATSLDVGWIRMMAPDSFVFDDFSPMQNSAAFLRANV
jgi:hypothetical protein